MWLSDKIKELVSKFRTGKEIPRSEVPVPDNGRIIEEERQKVLKQLLVINQNICLTQDIAKYQVCSDCDKLLNIILTQNVALEKYISSLGVQLVRSKQGDQFDPELMQVDQRYENTDKQELDGLVCCSVLPGVKKDDKILIYEQVRLYNYSSN